MRNAKQWLAMVGLAAAAMVPMEALAQTCTDVTSAQASRCLGVQAVIDQRLKDYTATRDRFVDALTRIDQRLTNIIGRADARGYDVATLTNDQTELKRRTTQIRSGFAALTAGVDQAGLQCGATGSLSVARQALETLQAHVHNTKAWTHEVLARDLAKLKRVDRS